VSDDAELQVGGALARLIAPAPGYVLVRFVILRLLGVVYFVAFLAAALQLGPLVGESGILPAQAFLDELLRHEGSTLAAFRRVPTLFVLTGASDAALTAVAWVGVALSLFVAAGLTNGIVMVVLWVAYLSISQVGQVFYGYGWELQLLETGILAAFLCPVRSFGPFPAKAPPIFAIWMQRWLIARIMLGAGLIKIRGDACWRDLTCLAYHYETQPIPGPLSPALHAMPLWLHKLGVGFNHLVELVAPFFAFWPMHARRIAGVLFVVFQVTLIVSGNLSFLNWLTLVPALACFDDRFLERLVPHGLTTAAEKTDARASRASLYASGGWALVVAMLSVEPVANLLSSRQAMNRSFEPLHLVNTYGAFGSVGRARYEIVLSGTRAEVPDDSAEWLSYELPCKPGDVERSLCWITPYHLRLDWQMWFLQFSAPEQNRWFMSLVDQLLAGNRKLSSLFAHDPFAGAPPVWIKADLYVYRFAHSGEATWERTWEATYLRPVRRDDPDFVRVLEAWSLR
jgi:hypothetical protein